MVEVVEQSVLLALMRRLRRRQRWTVAIEGAATGLGLVSASLAVGLLFARARGAPAVDFTPVLGVLALAIALGAVAGVLLRRSSLADCARAVDRAVAQAERDGSARPGAPVSDDCVLAALSLTGGGGRSTPFVAALVAVAIRRARRVPPAVTIRPPRWRWVALAAVALAILGGAWWAPQRLFNGARLAVSTPGSQRPPAKVAAPPQRIQLSAVALEAERDEAAAALKAAAATRDETLSRAAEEFQRLLAMLSGGGVEAAAALERLDRLARDAEEAGQAAAQAGTAAALAEMALRAAGRKGGAGGDPAKQLASALAWDMAAQAQMTAEAAARLAAAGEAGRAALAAAAGAAARSLSSAAGGEGATAAGGEQGRRLGELGGLDERAQSPHAETSDTASPGHERGEPQRRLEQLRRELEEGERGCQGDPAACGRTAENSGRALSQLQREGSTAEGRQRFAQAARQLRERIQRGAAGGAIDNTQRLRRFARAARGQQQSGSGPESERGTAGEPRAGAAVGDRAGSASTAPAAGSSPSAADDSASGAEGDDHSAEAGGSREGEEGGTGQRQPGSAGPSPHNSSDESGGPAASARNNGGEAAVGAGIGNAAGGPVMGPRQLEGGRRGHDTPVALPGEGPGASRAQVIDGAAAHGFTSTDYRRVFSDYRAAMEESMEAADVPAGKRLLVRRYFQLIRPRSNP